MIEHKNYDDYSKCKSILEELNYKPIKVMCEIPNFIYVNQKKLDLNLLNEKINWVDGWKKFNRNHKDKIYKFNIN